MSSASSSSSRRWQKRDRGLRKPFQDHYVRNDAAGRVALSKLSRWQRASIRFWGVIAHYAEARWLEANGWTRVRNGWLLPPWHPKRDPNYRSFKSKVADLTINLHEYEPYDQNHAANSQRYHLDVMQRPAPPRVYFLPQYPGYVRWLPYQLTVFAATSLLGAMVFATDGWVRWSFCVATLVGTLVGLFIAWRTQRDLKLDYVESRLRGAHEQEPQKTHGMHPAGRRC